MKIIYFIVVLIEITKKVQSLKCIVDSRGEFQDKTCKYPNDRFCLHANYDNSTITRNCMPKDHKHECTKMMHDGEMTTFCYCSTDLCNQDLKSCLKAMCTNFDQKARKMTNTRDEKCEPTCKYAADTKTTEGTGKNDQTTGEDNQQTTAGNDGEIQEATGAPAATSGNQRVVESNQFGFDLWILVIVIIKSL